MKVWKYSIEIEDQVDLNMPEDAELLHVASQTGRIDQLELWARVETTQPLETRRILIRGTGHPLDVDTDEISPYVGTVIVGPLVWHVFDGGAV